MNFFTLIGKSWKTQPKIFEIPILGKLIHANFMSKSVFSLEISAKSQTDFWKTHPYLLTQNRIWMSFPEKSDRHFRQWNFGV